MATDDIITSDARQPPSNVSIAEYSVDFVDLAWDKSDGVAAYNVFINGTDADGFVFADGETVALSDGIIELADGTRGKSKVISMVTEAKSLPCVKLLSEPYIDHTYGVSGMYVVGSGTLAESDPSEVTFMTGEAPTTTPTFLPPVITFTSLGLSWRETPQTDGYCLYIDGSIAYDGTDREFTATGLMFGAGYEISVSAYNRWGEGLPNIITAYTDNFDLITDRTLADVKRLKELTAKGWEDMSSSEQSEWMEGSSGVGVMWLNGETAILLDGRLELDGESINRGAYNSADLNRVETAVALFSDLLSGLPGILKNYAAHYNVAWDELFDVPYTQRNYVLDTKTDWNGEDIPSNDDMYRYLQNVRLLRESFEYTTVALPGSMSNLTYTGANAIEQVLVDLNTAANEFRRKIQRYIDNIIKNQIYTAEVWCGEV